MKCAVCGCSDFQACVDPCSGEACAWVEEQLCSFCIYAPLMIQCPLLHERVPLHVGFVLQ